MAKVSIQCAGHFTLLRRQKKWGMGVGWGGDVIHPLKLRLQLENHNRSAVCATNCAKFAVSFPLPNESNIISNVILSKMRHPRFNNIDKFYKEDLHRNDIKTQSKVYLCVRNKNNIYCEPRARSTSVYAFSIPNRSTASQYKRQHLSELSGICPCCKSKYSLCLFYLS